MGSTVFLLGERHHGVQCGLDSGLEELAGVVVEEEAPGDHAGEHDDGPEHAAVHVRVGLGLQRSSSQLCSILAFVLH